nr:retrovirus-related Pol polyprotein from transposon TNT 1-94 [Tanacetum cinerariifolium]
DSGFELTEFSDADYRGCKDTFKSTSSGAQFLGEKLVSWSSKKQDCTALSTAKAEYVSLSACCAQVLWMRTQLTNYGFHFNKIPIYCDSKSAIAISCNSVQHSRTKHITVRYHFIKEHVEKGTIELYFVKMDYQLVDLFTKALPADRFNYLVRRLGMRSLSPKELERLAKSQAFLVTPDVLKIYMQEFWATAMVHHHSIRFKLDNNKRIVNLEFLGHNGEIRKLTDVNINKLHQPWRSFAAIINKCLSGKSTGYDSLRLSQAQILWGLHHKKNVDFAYLLWKTSFIMLSIRMQRRETRCTIPASSESRPPMLNKENYVPWSSCLLRYAKSRPNGKLIHNSILNGPYVRKLIPEPGDANREITVTETFHLQTEDELSDKELKQIEANDQAIQTILLSLPEDIYPAIDSCETTQEIWLRVQKMMKGSDIGIQEKKAKNKHFPEKIANVHTTQEFEDTHVTLTLVNPDGQQQSSSVSSQFVRSMLNPTLDAEIDSLFETTSQMDVPALTIVASLTLSAPTLTPSTIPTISTVPQAPTPSTTAPSTLLQDLPNFGSLFRFDHRLKTLEDNFSKFVQTNQFDGVVSSIIKIVQRYMDQRMNEAVKILIKKMEGKKSIHRSDEQRNLYKALVEAYKSNKIILDTYGDIVTLKRRRDDDADKDEEPSAGSDQGSKRRREGKEPESTSAPKEKIRELAKQADSCSSFNELMDTHMDFSAFLMNLLKVDTLTSELLAGPTYKLMKGSCKSLVELEFFLEEVYKATTDRLDWNNLEGQQYPHNLLKPLPLIPNSRGRQVIPFDHFINNDLEYLRGGASSCKYTTSVTKTNATYYRHTKWIEDLVPRTMWSQEQVSYDKHALWGISHWGRKHQQFYEFTVNRESALDVYSKRRIIAVTELKIVEWHNYKHLDWVTVRRDDDKLYKFKEGDFKRLRIQDIKDMLLLLVQGKLKNLTVEERFAFNVSLRMFTRSIVIQRRVEDLQLGVKSYQKKFNLTKPDTYRSDLKRKEAYSAYSNTRGFIYQNKNKQNRLIQIDELHKFSDGTLNDVRTTLDDCLKGIRI